MSSNAYLRGYDAIINRIEKIIDYYLSEHIKKQNMLNDQLESLLEGCNNEKGKISQSAHEIFNIMDHISGMYEVKQILMCRYMVLLRAGNDYGFDAGKKEALSNIKDVILQLNKLSEEIEDEAEKEEYIIKITSAEYLYDAIKKEIEDIIE